MTKTLTEQWRDGTLERGYYYYKTKVGAKVIGYQCFGLKFPYDYNHNTIDSVEEVLAPVPSYDEYNELVQKMHTLENCLEVSEKAHYRTLEQLRIATKALEVYANTNTWCICNKLDCSYVDGSVACIALKEMEGVKCVKNKRK